MTKRLEENETGLDIKQIIIIVIAIITFLYVII